MYKILLLALWLCYPTPLLADTLLEKLYINPEHQKLPEALILHNSANPCENCDKAINMIINTLKTHYSKKLHAYLIDTNYHPEFMSAFKAYAPLTLVIIRISDGAAFGYNTLFGLQSLVDNKQDFSRRIIDFINNFLDNP